MAKAKQKAVDTTPVAAPQTETPAAPAPEQKAPEAPKTVTLRTPAGSKESPLYVITPTMGKRPRWFEKKRLSGLKALDGGVFEFSLPIREVKDRALVGSQWDVTPSN